MEAEGAWKKQVEEDWLHQWRMLFADQGGVLALICWPIS